MTQEEGDTGLLASVMSALGEERRELGRKAARLGPRSPAASSTTARRSFVVEEKKKKEKNLSLLRDLQLTRTHTPFKSQFPPPRRRQQRRQGRPRRGKAPRERCVRSGKRNGLKSSDGNFFLVLFFFRSPLPVLSFLSFSIRNRPSFFSPPSSLSPTLIPIWRE